jgi:hypothetical protein
MTLSRFAACLLTMGAVAGAAAAIAAPFAQNLSLQGVQFVVQARGEGSTQDLVVTAKEGAARFPAIKQQVDGTVSAAEVEDLNSDGRPELVLTVVGAGSGSYGSVLAWSASKGHRLLPINLPELTTAQAKGYMGHDRFAVVETTLVRRFPIYRDGDGNAKPTGGTRQIEYKLVAGEASWQFKPVRTTTMPR